MDEEFQKNYELTFILSPNLEEKEINSFEKEIEENIKSFKGSIKGKSALSMSGKSPEKHTFSYPIKNFQSGYYWTINFSFNPEKLKELYSALKHKKEILRYIITVAVEKTLLKKPAKSRKVEIKGSKKLAKEITEKEIEKIKKVSKKKKDEKKIELKDIDKKLDEILGT